jgi:23S rRNA pseudouridine1911/1915/1917 synthase
VITRRGKTADIRDLVLYEDNHLIAIQKPFGMLTQGDRTGDISLLDLARGYIKEKYQKPGEVYLGLVHRLDRPAGGVVVFSRTSKSAKRMSEKFREREVKKIYRAVVEGIVSPPTGELTHYLLKSGAKMKISTEDTPDGQEARLIYEVVDSRDDKSLLEINLITGRKHQIRAQMGAIGHPITGDIKYGSKTEFMRGAIALFSRSLTFTHPVSGVEMTISADPPEGFFKDLGG